MIKIWSNVHCSFAAMHLVNQLKKLGHESMIVSDWNPEDNSLHILYQVSNMWNFPKNYILMQTEPWCSHWFNKQYISSTIKNALAVWDYSEDNQNHYDHSKMAIVTPGINPQPEVKKDIPNLFYGWLEGSERRIKRVDAISKQIPLMVITNKTGPEMWNLLARTEIVYNIHYHEDSPLELYRICESLSHGCNVLNEMGDSFRSIKMQDNLEEIKNGLKLL